MRELQEILQQHRKKYPKMQPQDVVKLVYQNEFGPGHFVEDGEASLQRLKNEWEYVKKANQEAAAEWSGLREQEKMRERAETKVQTEAIGNGLCRVYLKGVSAKELTALNRMFVQTAKQRALQTVEDKRRFEEKLSMVKELLAKLSFSFSQEEFEQYVQGLKAKGYPPVSHSRQYRENYAPAYRVVDERYARFWGLLVEIEEKNQKNSKLVIGIDGGAASGKTTLAGCIAELYDGEVISMDDFFLPPDKRNKERLLEAGGNIHYERFMREVTAGICSGREFEYRVFSCHEMDYVGKRKISNQRMLVVEGVYSMREEFRKLYDYRIFMKTEEQEQKSRILKRNGAQMLQIFLDRWIPMENHYFKECKVEQHCDVTWTS